MSHALLLTTWPTDLGRGSGTALFIGALQRALQARGRSAELIDPGLDPDDYTRFVFERLWFNVRLAGDPRIAEAAWILGLDFDGFALPRRSDQPFIGSARAVFADLVETEPEPFRTLLRVQAFYERENLRACDLVTTPSEYAQGKLVEHYGIAPERIRVIPNGIDLAEWDALRSDLPEPDPSRPPTVLAVSRLFPRKRIEVLVRATPLLRRRFPDVEVRIVGGGFEWENLQRLARRIGAAPNVTWLGDVHRRREVVAEYRRCHVFAHPSIQDAFANACLEGLASSRPVVASDAACMPDLVRRSGGGRIVPPDDPEALAESVGDLLDDPVLRAELGRRGRAFAETLSWERAASSFLELVE